MSCGDMRAARSVAAMGSPRAAEGFRGARLEARGIDRSVADASTNA
jgi:hypothetical protein